MENCYHCQGDGCTMCSYDPVENAKGIKERIDNQWIATVHKISNIIAHFDWTISQFLLAMGEALEVIEEEEDPCLWHDFQEYRNRKERAYHTAMGWMVDEEQITQGEEQ